jgi:hypothetical protein
MRAELEEKPLCFRNMFGWLRSAATCRVVPRAANEHVAARMIAIAGLPDASDGRKRSSRRPCDRGAAIEAAQCELLDKLGAGPGHTKRLEHAATVVATFTLRVGYVSACSRRRLLFSRRT